jgi:HSP20 family protein
MKLITTYRNPGYYWSPFVSLQRELDRWFDGAPRSPECESAGEATWAPPLEVREEANAYVVQAEVPGVRKEDLQLSFHDDVLTLSGERKQEKEVKEGEVYRTERGYGRFQRTVALPKPVDPAKVTAAYKDGVLTITLPKTDAAKPRTIDISAN